MQKYISKSEQETKLIAARLTKESKTNIFALTGNLGTGKTTFAQGFAKGLNIKDKIISPTFVLIRQHKIPRSKKILFHIDLYRLNEKSGINGLGLKEILSDPNAIILIEWANQIKKLLPKNTTWINIEIINGEERKITIK